MRETVFYSVIVVCLNSGERLLGTVKSILSQRYGNYEMIVKDGGSTDGSVEALDLWVQKNKEIVGGRLRIFCQKDTGIYDAMNQAVELARGGYLIFMNTGDSFYDETVLEKVTNGILEKKTVLGVMPDIVYGNMYHKALDTMIYAAPQMNDFTCYRNVPCHQTCFYNREMFRERGYNPNYTVRADYEHFLWCFYEKQAQICYLPVVVASYEGGGYSETKENRRHSAEQHREIVVRYMGKRKANQYRILLLLTLAPLRSALAESRHFSSLYHGMKGLLYRAKRMKEGDEAT